MGTPPLGPKYIPYTYMDPLGKHKRAWRDSAQGLSCEAFPQQSSPSFPIAQTLGPRGFLQRYVDPVINMPPTCEGLHAMIPNINPLKGRGFINHGFGLPDLGPQYRIPPVRLLD